MGRVRGMSTRTLCDRPKLPASTTLPTGGRYRSSPHLRGKPIQKSAPTSPPFPVREILPVLGRHYTGGPCPEAERLQGHRPHYTCTEHAPLCAPIHTNTRSYFEERKMGRGNDVRHRAMKHGRFAPPQTNFAFMDDHCWASCYARCAFPSRHFSHVGAILIRVRTYPKVQRRIARGAGLRTEHFVSFRSMYRPLERCSLVWRCMCHGSWITVGLLGGLRGLGRSPPSPPPHSHIPYLSLSRRLPGVPYTHGCRPLQD